MKTVKILIAMLVFGLMGFTSMGQTQEFKQNDFNDVEYYEELELKKKHEENTTNFTPKKYFCCSPHYNLPASPAINVMPVPPVQEGTTITISTPTIFGVNYQWVVKDNSGNNVPFTPLGSNPSITVSGINTIGKTYIIAYLYIRCGEKTVKSKRLIKIISNPCKCEKNIVSNGEFFENLNVSSGSTMPGASTKDWVAATHTPQLYAGEGGCQKAFVAMWGNRTVSESIAQKLSTPLQAGKKYLVRFHAKNVGAANRAPYIRFKIKGTNALPTGNTPANTTGFDLCTTSNISTTTWTAFSFIVTIPANYSHISVYPEYDSTNSNGGNTTDFGSGMFDSLCITELK